MGFRLGSRRLLLAGNLTTILVALTIWPPRVPMAC